MAVFVRLFLCCILPLLCSWQAMANQSKTENLLEVAVGWTKPPYVIAKDNSGFELELIDELFKSLGKQVNFIYIPYGRSYSMLKRGEVDVVMTLKPGIDIGETAVLSDSYVTYQNVVVGLNKENLTIRRFNDIAKHSIVGFQNAHLHLGKAYAKSVAKSPMYLELADQRKQVEMLIMKRVDLVAMDINIFKYWLGQDHPQLNMSDIKVFRLFDKNPYHLGLKNAELKTAFNDALAKFKASGQYDRLVMKYRLEK